MLKYFKIKSTKVYEEIHWQSISPIDSVDKISKLLDFIFVHTEQPDCVILVKINSRVFYQSISRQTWKYLTSKQIHNMILRDVDELIAVCCYTKSYAKELIDKFEKAMVWDALTL